MNWAQQSNVNLFLVFGDNSVSLSVYSNHDKTFLAHQLFPLIASKSIAENCSSVWNRLPYQRLDFSKIRVGILANYSSIFPLQFENKTCEDLFAFDFGLEKEDCLQLRIKSNSNHKIASMLNPEIVEWCKSTFKTPEFFSTTEIANNTSHNQTEKNTAHIYLYNNVFELLVKMDNEVVIQNKFDYNSTEDITYYTLYSLDQLDIERSELKFYLSSMTNDEAIDFELIKKFIDYQPMIENEKTPTIPFQLLLCE